MIMSNVQHASTKSLYTIVTYLMGHVQDAYAYICYVKNAYVRIMIMSNMYAILT